MLETSDLVFLDADRAIDLEVSGLSMINYPEDIPSQPVCCLDDIYPAKNQTNAIIETGMPPPQPSVLTKAPLFHIMEEEVSWLQCAVQQLEAQSHCLSFELSQLVQCIMRDDVESDSVSKDACQVLIHSSSIYDDFLQGHAKHVRQQVDARRLYRETLDKENRNLRYQLQAQATAAELREEELLKTIKSQKLQCLTLQEEIIFLHQRLEQERAAALQAAAEAAAVRFHICAFC